MIFLQRRLLIKTILFCGIVNSIANRHTPEDGIVKKSHEERLIDDLLRDYNKFAHPKSYINKTFNFTVTFGIEIVQLVAVEDRNQRIVTNCWVRQRWTNYGLRWNPAHYNNITKIRISAEKVWIPDIMLYNSADTQQASGGLHKYRTSIIITNDGNHSWFAPASFISTCKISVRYFPFDRQRCIMQYGSWTYQMNDLDIVSDRSPIVTSEYLRSAEWDLGGAWVNRSVTSYACCKYPYSDLRITLEIRRRPLFYIFNLMMPCFIIIAMVLIGFFLPPESGERATLSITVLLAMAVFLQLQAEYLPRNSEEIPLLGTFYVTVMAEIGLSLVATCYVLNIFHKNSGVHIVPMNHFVIRFFLGIVAPLLCVSAPIFDDTDSSPIIARQHSVNGRTKTESDTQVQLLEGATQPEAPSLERSMSFVTPGSNGVLRKSSRGFARPTRYSSLTSRPLITSSSPSCPAPGAACSRLMAQNCAVLADNVRQKREIRLDQERWRFLARVLDRMFFIIFILTICTSTMLIYLKADGN